MLIIVGSASLASKVTRVISIKFCLSDVLVCGANTSVIRRNSTFVIYAIGAGS